MKTNRRIAETMTSLRWAQTPSAMWIEFTRDQVAEATIEFLIAGGVPTSEAEAIVTWAAECNTDLAEALSAWVAAGRPD